MTLNRVGFGTLRRREIPTFHAFAGYLATDGFGDQLGEKNLSLVSGVETVIFVEIDSDGRRGRRHHDAGVDPIEIDTLARIRPVVEANVCEQARRFPHGRDLDRLLL